MSEQALRRKLFLAGREAEAVEKNGEAENFKYAKATDVIAEASRVLEAQGLLVIPSVEDVQLRFGKTGALATVSMTFEICDPDSEETLTKAWSGTGWDFPGDKAIYAAITGAKKYFLGSLLDIPFGVDPEDPEPDDEGSAEARRIAAEQDRDAEQPDAPKDPDGQEPGAVEGDSSGGLGVARPSASEAPAPSSPPLPAPAASVEDELPADREGLS